MTDKLSTKDVKVGGGTPKTLHPGNQLAKINSVELEDFKFKPGAYNFIMHMEGLDLGKDFDGFWINKDDQSLGKHKGQVGRVKSSEWAFADGETKSGIKISRDQDIMKFMKQLCTALGPKCLKWFDDQDKKHETIESLVVAFNKDKPFEGIFINWCIGGKEYEGKTGYTNYDLHLPKFTKTNVPFEAADAKPSKIIVFDTATHIKKKEAKAVENFGEAGATDDAKSTTSPDFEL
jgi:hypothetical protein